MDSHTEGILWERESQKDAKTLMMVSSHYLNSSCTGILQEYRCLMSRYLLNGSIKNLESLLSGIQDEMPGSLFWRGRVGCSLMVRTV